MGKNYDRYSDSVKGLQQARLDLSVAHGGSTGEHMDASQLGLHIAQEENDLAYDKMMNDPEG